MLPFSPCSRIGKEEGPRHSMLVWTLPVAPSSKRNRAVEFGAYSYFRGLCFEVLFIADTSTTRRSMNHNNASMAWQPAVSSAETPSSFLMFQAHCRYHGPQPWL